MKVDRSTVRQHPMVRSALVRPVSMLMIFISACVFGIISANKMPLELLPSGLTAPFMSVVVPYNNATARDVEDKITKPLESSVATMAQLDRMVATSSSTQGRINLIFDQDADMDRAYRDLRDRVDRARPDLPSDVDLIRIRKHSADSFPVGFYGISWPPTVTNPRDLVRRHLIRKLERIEGVGFVRAMGNEDPEIRIEVDRERARAANLDIVALVSTLRSAHFTLASGELRDSKGLISLRSLAEFRTPDELEQVVVGPKGVRLKDVANVVYDYPPKKRLNRYMGRDVMALFILKESEANTAEVCSSVEAVLAEARLDPALKGFEFRTFFNQADTIHAGLSQVIDSGLQGGVLAVFVLLFFLSRLRLTVVIAASIPISMFLALPPMYFWGQSINLVSLIGLMICVGLVVDNSVVVAENIARHRSAGMSVRVAALHGASEVALPITLATTTTMVVFLPAALASKGVTQYLMVQMVTPVCISLLASLFFALVLIPLFVVRGVEDKIAWVQRVRLLAALDRRWKALVAGLYARTFAPIQRRYARLLARCLERRIDVLMVFLAAFMSLGIPMNPETGVKSAIQDDDGQRQINVNYTVPSAESHEDMAEFVYELEKWFLPRRARFDIEGEYMETEEGFLKVSIFFNKPKRGQRSLEERADELYKEMPTPVGWTKESQRGDADAKRETFQEVTLYGHGHEELQMVKEALEQELLKLPGVISLSGRGRDRSRRPELQLQMRASLAQRYGISSQMVGQMVAFALRGAPLPKLRGPDAEIEVTALYQESDRDQLDELMRFDVPSVNDEPISLSTLTETRIRRADPVLVRYNKRTAVAIELELEEEGLEETKARIRRYLDRYGFPEGITLDTSQGQRELDAEQAQTVLSLGLGAVFIFLIMCFLFESLILPLSVLPAILASVIGVYWALYLTDSKFDSLVGIGVLLLMGVVVNNAIVLVDFINTARRQGVPRAEAVVQAGIHRFRPILMTSFTTVGGMLPLAFASAPEGGIAYGPFGRALVGGLMSSTLLTLVIVPVAYTLFDDLQSELGIWLRRQVERGSRGR